MQTIIEFLLQLSLLMIFCTVGFGIMVFIIFVVKAIIYFLSGAKDSFSGGNNEMNNDK